MTRARTILWGKLAWHPAVKAWLTFARDAAEPETIEVLRNGSTAAWRLEGVGPEGAAIIARRLPAARAAAARAVYERLLARLPIQKRSEEHTSELQSRGHLVCRLLLENKKDA